MSQSINGFRTKLLKNRTESEIALAWYLWKKTQHKFEEQYPIILKNNTYYLDFFFPDYFVGVELEGGIHKTRIEYDSARQTSLENLVDIRTGLTMEIIRLDNDVLSFGLENTARVITTKVRERKDLFDERLSMPDRIERWMNELFDFEGKKAHFINKSIRIPDIVESHQNTPFDHCAICDSEEFRRLDLYFDNSFRKKFPYGFKKSRISKLGRLSFPEMNNHVS